MGRRIKSKDLIEAGICGPGLVKGIAILDQLDGISMADLDIAADAMVGREHARMAREALDMIGTDPNATAQPLEAAPITPDGFTQPDTLAPGEADYGDTAPDGSGASYARQK